jgi:hypothetical protein
VDQTVQKGAGGKYNRLAFDNRPVRKLDSSDPIAGESDFGYFALDDRKVLSIRKGPSHFRSIQIAVSLRARGLHGGAAAAIEQPELNPGRVDDLPHYSAECVDFADEMALCYATDSRVATHLPDRIRVERHKRGAHTDARRDVSGFTAGVASSDYD